MSESSNLKKEEIILKVEKPGDLPFDVSQETLDLWTIFTSCPIERGKISVYNAFSKARERAYINLNDKIKLSEHDKGMDM